MRLCLRTREGRGLVRANFERHRGKPPSDIQTTLKSFPSWLFGDHASCLLQMDNIADGYPWSKPHSATFLNVLQRLHHCSLAIARHNDIPFPYHLLR